MLRSTGVGGHNVSRATRRGAIWQPWSLGKGKVHLGVACFRKIAYLLGRGFRVAFFHIFYYKMAQWQGILLKVWAHSKEKEFCGRVNSGTNLQKKYCILFAPKNITKCGFLFMHVFLLGAWKKYSGIWNLLLILQSLSFSSFGYALFWHPKPKPFNAKAPPKTQMFLFACCIELVFRRLLGAGSKNHPKYEKWVKYISPVLYQKLCG